MKRKKIISLVTLVGVLIPFSLFFNQNELCGLDLAVIFARLATVYADTLDLELSERADKENNC